MSISFPSLRKRTEPAPGEPADFQPAELSAFSYAARTVDLSALCATFSSVGVLLQTRASSFTGRFIASQGAVIGTAVTEGSQPQENVTIAARTIASERKVVVFFISLSSVYFEILSLRFCGIRGFRESGHSDL